MTAPTPALEESTPALLDRLHEENTRLRSEVGRLREQWQAAERDVHRLRNDGVKTAIAIRRDERERCAKITRVEVINHMRGANGREYITWRDDMLVSLSFQDDGRTLKVFLSDRSQDSGGG